jgi:uncharacterized protein (TIGR00299 family) protein
MHIHLDALGGVAGDMFIAAVLDAFPDLCPPFYQMVAAIPFPGLAAAGPPAVRVEPWRDHTFAGRRLTVDEGEHHDHGHDHDHGHGHGHGHGHHDGHRHGHIAWAAIRDMLNRAALPDGVRGRAIAIFSLLAGAEAAVHGVAVDEVSFHEVGATDSILDIVGAAFLIDTLDAARWSVSSLPLGSGRVRSAHGPLPVPAPATARLLAGFVTHDDGIPGERVTPTGAAILRHLGCVQEPHGAPRRLVGSGVGFGSRVMPGISNCLRLLAFEPVSGPGARPAAGPVAGGAPGHRELAVVEFEVDDQPAEDLALGLDRLRATAGVFDVVQMPAFGKKGRMATHVRLLAAPAALDAVIAACFQETATIGLRHHLVRGAALPRRMAGAEVDGRRLRIKLVRRPDGAETAKAEADDVAGAPGGRAGRLRLRRAAEDRALAAGPPPAGSPEETEA